MKKLIFYFFLIAMVFSVGCKNSTKNETANSHITTTGNVITNAVNTIDGYLVDSPLKTKVKEQTDTIRKSILELSFEKIDTFYVEQISALNKANEVKLKNLNNTIKERDAKISGLTKLLEKANKKIDELENAARENQLTILTWVATILVVASGVLLYFGQRGLAGIGVTVSFLLFGVMQVIGNPIFVYCIFGLILICIIASFALFYHQKIRNETNVIVMSVIEDFYNNQDQKTKDWLDSTLFVELSKKMDKVHKNIVKKTSLPKNEPKKD
jgi:hypothetical protein